MSIRYKIIQLLVGVLLFVANTNAQITRSTMLNDRIIVKFKTPHPILIHPSSVATDKKSMAVFDILNNKYGVSNIYEISSRNPNSESYRTTYSLVFGSSIDISSVIADYISTGLFEYVEEDGIGVALSPLKPQGIIPNSEYFHRQWALDNDGTFTERAVKDADMNMPEAWEITTGDSSVTVAVIDAGLKLDHPAFNGRIWVNHNDVSNNGIDDDSNGYIDDALGWDFVNSDSFPIDDNGHGTAVTGILAANGDGGLYAGIDWKCKLMILKVLNAYGGTPFSRVAEAINYATENKARIINISIGGTTKNQTMQNAITDAYNAGVLVVCGMANNDVSAPFYPAACTNAFAVGATCENDHRVGSAGSPSIYGSGGSNFGNHIKVVAPGNFIYYLSYLSDTHPDQFAWGTSLSTAYVSGLASLLVAQDPTRNADSLSAIITRTAQDQVGLASEDVQGWDKYHGFGRINAFAALNEYHVSVPSAKPELTLDYNIYPNPANTTLTIFGLNGTAMEFEIIDVAGRRIWSGTLNMMHSQIDISRFANGVYTIREAGSAPRSLKRFIVAH